MPGKAEKKVPAGSQEAAPLNITKLLLRWAPAIIILITALIYSRAVQNDITYFDDDYYILQNPYIRYLDWHGLKNIFTTFYSSNYHPFTTLGWAVIFRFFRTDPLPYHLFNVLLHLLNTWLVFKVTERLSRQRITAIVASLLFAIHPMHVESVAWISELKDVLYTAFYLAALLAYLQYAAKGFASKYYVAALLFFVASLFSKSAAVTLPVLLIVIDVYQGRKVTGRTLLEKAPFFLFAIVFGLLNVHSQGIADLSSFGSVNRVFVFTGGLAFYLVKFIAPFNLCLEHYFPMLHGKMLPLEYYLSVPFLLLLAWLVIRRSSFRRELLFGMAFFLVTISIMLQLIPVGSALAAERYTYISYIGLFYIVGQFVAKLIETDKWRVITISVGSLVIVLFSLLTWNRIGVWKNSDTLFSDVTNKNPDNGNICFVLWSWGNAKAHEGDFEMAIRCYSAALKINAAFQQAFCNRGEAYDNAGNVKAAIEDYDKAIQLDPKSSDAYTNRGWAHYQSGDTQLAMNDYNKAIALNTFGYKDKYAETYNDRGWAWYGKGDTQYAMTDFIEATRLNPYFGRPYLNIAMLKSNRGDLKGAIDEYGQLLSYNPDDKVAYYMRGIAHYYFKDNRAACEDWNKAASLGNENATQLLQRYCR